ncbi:MAG: DNA polymerase I, partial [Coriobacteriales bacterium]|nr:DNA polymerase I [Coriobacteriales bacterium]
MARTIAVIDGNSLLHRAFHAVQTPMTAPDGRPTNAIFGFLSMLLKLYGDFTPDGIICAFDKGIPAFRMAALEQYKAQRPPTDPNLKEQFPMIKEVLESLAIPVVQLEGWEGDDILGSLAVASRKAGINCLLVTGDKDALQLVDETTKVVNTRTGMSDVVIYDSKAVFAKWGVRPDQIPDFLGLMGDLSDNIPGVPGVGQKKALALLEEYGDLESVLAHAGEIKGKLGENLSQNMELARLSREVATIRTDLDLDCPIEEISFPNFDAEEVVMTFSKFALASHLKKILKLIGTSPELMVSKMSATPATLATPGLDPVELTVGQGAQGTYGVHGAHGAHEMQPVMAAFADDSLADCPLLEGDEAIQALPELCRLAERLSVHLHSGDATGRLFSDTPTQLFVAGEQLILGLSGDDNIDSTLVQLFKRGNLACFDFKALLSRLWPADTSQAVAISRDELQLETIFDCRLAAYLLDSGNVPLDVMALGKLYQAELGLLWFDEEPNEQSSSESGPNPQEIRQQVRIIRRSARYLEERMDAEGSAECYWHIENPL